MVLVYFFIALLASVLGAVSGIGGGIVIKPVLDGIGAFSVSAVGFYSGSTVLSMAAVTLLRSRRATESVNRRVGTILAVGGVAGGLLGKYLLDLLLGRFGDDRIPGATQSALLFLMTLGVLFFTFYKPRIRPMHRDGNGFCLAAGLVLGAVASFLGIGGGPINLAVLYFFFSMESKTAALNSLYIIFFSQLTSLVFSFVSGRIPPFNPQILLAMITGGITGGLTGSLISRRLSHRGVDRLFMAVLAGILIVCVYNFLGYLQG